MGRLRFVIVLMLAVAALAPARVEAQRLGAVSSAVHGGGGGGGGYRGGGGGGGYRGGYRGYGYGYGGGGYVQTSPWVSLYYPYYFGYTGTIVRQDAIVQGRHFEGPPVIGIVDASAGYVFDGVVRGQVSGRVRITNVMDIEARYGAYFEFTDAAVREIGLGRLAIAFPFVAEETVQIRAGIAGHLYHDVVGPALGYAALMEADIYPTSPLVIHLEGEMGMLGQAFFGDARATVGMQIDRGELYIGWQVFAVDPFTTSSAVLHGPVAGVRVWIS
jgi:hypothetical protein